MKNYEVIKKLQERISVEVERISEVANNHTGFAKDYHVREHLKMIDNLRSTLKEIMEKGLDEEYHPYPVEELFGKPIWEI